MPQEIWNYLGHFEQLDWYPWKNASDDWLPMNTPHMGNNFLCKYRHKAWSHSCEKALQSDILPISWCQKCYCKRHFSLWADVSTMIVWKMLRLLLYAGVKPLQTMLLATTKWHTSSMRCQSQGWLYFMYVMLAGYWWLLPSLSLPCPSWQAGSTIEVQTGMTERRLAANFDQ